MVTFSKVDKEGKKFSVLKRCDCCYYMAFNKEDIISKINLNVFEQTFCIFFARNFMIMLEKDAMQILMIAFS